MQSTDTVSCMFVSILNACERKKQFVLVPYSKFSYSILKVIKQYGFITDLELMKDTVSEFKTIKVLLKYKNNQSVITELKRISKSGRRVYSHSEDLKKVKNGYGISILTTSKGVMSNIEARANRVGGEIVGVVC